MTEIRDYFHKVICKGDPKTGRLDYIDGKRGLSVTLRTDQAVMIQRERSISFVTWSPRGFYVDSRPI